MDERVLMSKIQLCKLNFDAQKASLSIPPRKVVQKIPPVSTTAKSVYHMNEKDRAKVAKLHDIGYYIGLHVLPFTQFEHLVKLEKLHNVSFTGIYGNEFAYRNLIINIAEYFFSGRCQKDNRSGEFCCYLERRANIKKHTEEEVIFVIYVDPDTNLSVMNFFKIVAPENSEDASGLKEAIISTFSRHGFHSVVKKMVFLSSDGASVNS